MTNIIHATMYPAELEDGSVKHKLEFICLERDL